MLKTSFSDLSVTRKVYQMNILRRGYLAKIEDFSEESEGKITFETAITLGAAE